MADRLPLTPDEFRALAQRLGAPFFVLVCEAPSQELCRRLAQRKDDASEATAAVLEQQLAWVESLGEDEQPFVVSPDT